MRRIVLYYHELPILRRLNRGWFSADGVWRIVSASSGRWFWVTRRSVCRVDYPNAAEAARRLSRHAGAPVKLARDRRWIFEGGAIPDNVGPPPSPRWKLRGREDLRVLTGALPIPDPEAP